MPPNSVFAEEPDAFLLTEFTDLARQCLQQGRPADALMFCNKALSIAPFKATLWFDKAQALGMGGAQHETRLPEVCNCLSLATQFSADPDREAMATRSAAFILERCNHWHAAAVKAWQSMPPMLDLQGYSTMKEELAQAMDCACKLRPADGLLQQRKADFSQCAVPMVAAARAFPPGLGPTAL